jgi:hypothetical protein
MRGKQIQEHNAMVERTGQGEFIEERVTDYDETVCYYLNLNFHSKNFPLIN